MLVSVTPMDYELPSASVYEISQSKILEKISIPFSRRSSWLKDQTQESPALQADSLLSESTIQLQWILILKKSGIL